MCMLLPFILLVTSYVVIVRYKLSMFTGRVIML
ncbi:hypothetical protein LINPERPRIM_LOCUS15075 [Linum perenne]